MGNKHGKRSTTTTVTVTHRLIDTSREWSTAEREQLRQAFSSHAPEGKLSLQGFTNALVDLDEHLWTNATFIANTPVAEYMFQAADVGKSGWLSFEHFQAVLLKAVKGEPAVRLPLSLAVFKPVNGYIHQDGFENAFLTCFEGLILVLAAKHMDPARYNWLLNAITQNPLQAAVKQLWNEARENLHMVVDEKISVNDFESGSDKWNVTATLDQTWQATLPFATLHVSTSRLSEKPEVIGPVSAREAHAIVQRLREQLAAVRAGTLTLPEPPKESPLTKLDLFKSFNEFSEKSAFSELEAATVHEVFNRYSQNGVLDRTSFASALEHLDKLLAHSSFFHGVPIAERLFDIFDKNNDGQIDSSEFVFGISILCKGSLHQKLLLSFKAMDLNNDGVVSKDEFIDIYTKTMMSLITTLFALKRPTDAEGLAAVSEQLRPLIPNVGAQFWDSFVGGTTLTIDRFAEVAKDWKFDAHVEDLEMTLRPTTFTFDLHAYHK